MVLDGEMVARTPAPHCLSSRREQEGVKWGGARERKRKRKEEGGVRREGEGTVRNVRGQEKKRREIVRRTIPSTKHNSTIPTLHCIYINIEGRGGGWRDY
jgi:hypothetical protein